MTTPPRNEEVAKDMNREWFVGEAEKAFNLFMRGRLRPGFCCERKRGRGFFGWRKDSGRRR